MRRRFVDWKMSLLPEAEDAAKLHERRANAVRSRSAPEDADHIDARQRFIMELSPTSLAQAASRVNRPPKIPK
jgi:hypothetical protein